MKDREKVGGRTGGTLVSQMDRNKTVDMSSEKRGGPEKNSVSHTFKKECVCVVVRLCVCESDRERG